MNVVQQPLSINVNVAGFVPVDVTLQPQSSAAPQVPAPKAEVVLAEASLHRVNLHDFLVKQVGRFVTLDFTKVDGADRTLNGRLGVRKHLKGGTNKVAAADRPYLVVYDVKTKGYRAVNLATVIEVRAQHTRYTVIG
jgi:hypothetical protein